jgi:hypothetical protein
MAMKAVLLTHRFLQAFCLFALLALGQIRGLAAQTVLPPGSTWRYLDTGVDPGTSWRAREFNDASWLSGSAPLGYGDPVATTVSFGPDPNAKYPATYFRTRFVVNDPSLYGSVEVRLRRDDGGVVYLNGVEVFRNNMPPGDIIFTTFASSVVDGTGETTFFSGGAPNLLVAGTNVLAVEIHQANGTSSDIGFDLELVGNAAPTVAIVSPTNNAVLVGPADITLSANPVDSDGTTSKVEFFESGQKLGEDTSSPFSLLLSQIEDGIYSFMARATDDTGGKNDSPPVTVTVNDPNPPRVVSASGTTNQVRIRFSKRLDPVTAANIANYQLSNTVTISSAVLSSDSKTVTLNTGFLEPGRAYAVIVNGVQDLAGQPVAPNSRASFVVEVFSFQTVGTAPGGGSVVGVAGGYDVRAAGRDISDTGDDFGFYSQSRTGDFDVAARIASLQLADGYSRAGLMARASLATNSPFAAVLASSALGGAKFESRTTTNGAATDGRSIPVNYPYTWLRLQRAGNIFTGFGSFDGKTWMQLGSATIAAPAALYLGFAVSSHNPATTVLAQFRDLQDVTGGTVVNQIDLPFEPLGPSSRRTSLVISEIMYHPPEVPGLSLEYIEIFNAQEYYEDLSGYKIDGDVHYAFPPGTVLQSGAFVVVARDPAAVQSYYGITGVLGPWRLKTNITATATNIAAENLPNSRGTVRLEDELGAHLLQVDYDSQYPWPAAADGAGHSLVLARPSYGEGNAQAWAISESIGGSPGRAEIYVPESQRAVVINEFLAHTDDPQTDFIELFNTSPQAVDISGCWLSDDFGTNKFRIPDGTVLPGRGFITWDEHQLGFSLSADGEEILLVNSNRTRVLDAVRFGGQANGVSRGRFPDGFGAATLAAQNPFVELGSPTPATNNAAPLQRDIVINEIMYHPISGNDDDEYVELYNRGIASVNVGDWRLVAGVSFTIPLNTIMPAGGYLVLAKNRTNLLSRYPGLSAGIVFGDYGGQLGNGGERVALAMPDYSFVTNGATITTNSFYIVVNEVTYGDGGRWGQWADGGGSSLELIDPRADNRLAANWADSDESAKASWTLIERTALIDLGMGGTFGAPNRFECFIEGAGECLLDDVEVRNNGGANVLPNPGFESGAGGWAFAGTHAKTFVQTGGAFTGTQCLHLRAVDRGDAGPNKVRAGIPALTTGGANNATLRARVRWLRGDPNFLMRIRGQWIEATGKMTVPANLGTPGAANSRLVSNAGPAIYDVSHHPALPAANEPVVVTARINDPDGLAGVTLRYRIDPGNNVVDVPMKDDGTGGDEFAGDGLYSGTIPGQALNVMVAFHVRATDANAAPVTSLFPNNAPNRECLVSFGETNRAGSIGTYHLWVTTSNINYWTARERNSNEGIDCTFVYGEGRRVVYNAETLYSGSPWHTANAPYTGPLGNTCDYEVNFPNDDLLLGTASFVLNGQNPVYSVTFNQDISCQAEHTAYWFGRKLGLGVNHKRHVFVTLNGQPRGMVYFDHQQPNSEIIQEYYPNDPNGRLHKIEDWFEFDDQGDGFSIITCTLENFVVGGQKRTERYRFTWRPRGGTDPNDFADLFTAVDAANAASPEPYTSATFGEIDIPNWMRVLALEHMVGDWDSYGYERGKNMFAYKPTQDKWKLVLWDVELVLGKDSRGPTDGLFNNGAEPIVTRMYNHPPFVREFWRAMYELANIWMDPAVYSPLVDARYAAFRANGVPVDSPDSGNSVGASGGMRGWIAARRAYILSQIPSANFAVTSTNYVQTTNNYITLTGTAPVSAKQILVNGGSYPITWTTVTTWTVRVPLAPGTNTLVVSTIDGSGEILGSATVTANYTGTAPDPTGFVVMNEIMFNSPVNETSYLELFNTHASFTFDLSGWRINGLGYTFPPGSVFPPRSYLLLTKNRTEFGKLYGAFTPVFDEFGGALDNNGETLTLLRPGSQLGSEIAVDKVKYEARPPWSARARGLGGSLQLIDPAQDHARVSNWTDGRDWRFFSFTGAPNSTRLLFYLDTAGELFIDDLMLVSGSVAGVGTNLLANSGFESGLAPAWQFFGVNGTNTARSADARLNGDFGLDMKFSAPGGSSHFVYQDIPSFATTAVHTISFWYLPSTNAANYLFRMSTGFRGTVNVRAPTGPQGLFGTPATNNVLTTSIAPYPLLWLNEVLPVNSNGITDNQGEREPWIELFNSSSNQITLTDFFLSDDYSRLGKWRFPAGAVINPGEFKVIFADAEPGESTSSEWHTAFRLSASSDSLNLSRLVNGTPQLLDYLNFGGLTPTRSYGSYLDGQLFDRQEFYFATPGAPNNPASPPIAVYINEWMAANAGFIRDPADNDADDWFELYNGQSTPVDLGGYFLTDNLTNQFQFAIPNNGHYVIPGLGYLLVWADGEPNQNSTNRADLHVNFQLRQAGEAIGLFAPDGALVDAVTFGAQTANVSEGRYPSGTGPIYTMQVSSPRTANQNPNTVPQIIAISTSGTQVSFTISAVAGRTYRIEQKSDLSETSWTPLGNNRVAAGPTLTVQDDVAPGSQRFYRVALVP